MFIFTSNTSYKPTGTVSALSFQTLFKHDTSWLAQGESDRLREKKKKYKLHDGKQNVTSTYIQATLCQQLQKIKALLCYTHQNYQQKITVTINFITHNKIL